jgi:hypothetical protein
MSIAPETSSGWAALEDDAAPAPAVAHSGDSVLVAWAGQAGGVAVSIDH